MLGDQRLEGEPLPPWTAALRRAIAEHGEDAAWRAYFRLLTMGERRVVLRRRRVPGHGRGVRHWSWRDRLALWFEAALERREQWMKEHQRNP